MVVCIYRNIQAVPVHDAAVFFKRIRESKKLQRGGRTAVNVQTADKRKKKALKARKHQHARHWNRSWGQFWASGGRIRATLFRFLCEPSSALGLVMCMKTNAQNTQSWGLGRKTYIILEQQNEQKQPNSEHAQTHTHN